MELERKNLEIQQQQAKEAFGLRKAELLTSFQNDLRRIEAELMKSRMETQSIVFSKFIDFMRDTLKTNDSLIIQQTKLYELSLQNEAKCELFLEKAEKLQILDTKQLIDIGAAKVKELNLESSQELQKLELKIESILGVTQGNNSLAIMS